MATQNNATKTLTLDDIRRGHIIYLPRRKPISKFANTNYIRNEAADRPLHDWDQDQPGKVYFLGLRGFDKTIIQETEYFRERYGKPSAQFYSLFLPISPTHPHPWVVSEQLEEVQNSKVGSGVTGGSSEEGQKQTNSRNTRKYPTTTPENRRIDNGSPSTPKGKKRPRQPSTDDESSSSIPAPKKVKTQHAIPEPHPSPKTPDTSFNDAYEMLHLTDGMEMDQASSYVCTWPYYSMPTWVLERLLSHWQRKPIVRLTGKSMMLVEIHLQWRILANADRFRWGQVPIFLGRAQV